MSQTHGARVKCGTILRARNSRQTSGSFCGDRELKKLNGRLERLVRDLERKTACWASAVVHPQIAAGGVLGSAGAA